MYHTPLAVQPEFEFRNTPDNYRATYAGPGKLPDRIKVWRVQSSPKGNVLAQGLGFLDSPDTEILALGFNLRKVYGDIGISRQGSFLQWGYGDPPSQMTEAGRRLFVNCIHYIRRFDGKVPLVRRRAEDRRRPLMAIVSDKKQLVLQSFPPELCEKYQGDPNGLLAYYKANLELAYRDVPGSIYHVDEELKSLGIDFNRKVETLDRLIALLDDTSQAATAKKLLARYTDVSFETPQQWRQWFDTNRERIYFTDVGGYRFEVMPEGYLIHP